MNRIYRNRLQTIAMATLRRDGRVDVRDLRRVLSLPEGVHHNNIGIAFAELARKQVIQPLGHARSDWRGGNAHHVTVWQPGPMMDVWVDADEAELPEIQGELFGEGAT